MHKDPVGEKGAEGYPGTSIATKYFTEEGKFKMGEFMKDYEVTIMNYQNRINALEEAISFFAKWWNETQDPDRKDKVEILVPEYLKDYKSKG
jgi:hypothetical protein